MPSFPAMARRVRDTELGLRDRLLSLRECVLCFAPYGFRPTCHHLIVSVRVPKRLEDDPQSLLRALDELEEARLFWLAQNEEYAARRRREKAAGNRTPRRSGRWRGLAWLIAYCPTFEKHPTERMAVVVQRVIAAYESGADLVTTCCACGRALTEDAACPSCGVDPLGPFARRPGIRPRTTYRWREVWQRSGARAAR